MTSEDPHVRALRELLAADRDAYIARAQRWADEAAAAGDEWGYRLNLEDVARLKAQRFSWEEPAA